MITHGRAVLVVDEEAELPSGSPGEHLLGSKTFYVARRWLPPTGVCVRVTHQGSEKIAYLDSEGKWRKETNGDVLRGAVSILGLRGNSKNAVGVLLGPNPSREEIEAFCARR